jgi:hypothetical protein
MAVRMILLLAAALPLSLRADPPALDLDTLLAADELPLTVKIVRPVAVQAELDNGAWQKLSLAPGMTLRLARVDTASILAEWEVTLTESDFRVIKSKAFQVLDKHEVINVQRERTATGFVPLDATDLVLTAAARKAAAGGEPLKLKQPMGFILLRKQKEVGRLVLPAGTSVPMLERRKETVRIGFAGSTFEIPKGWTDFFDRAEDRRAAAQARYQKAVAAILKSSGAMLLEGRVTGILPEGLIVEEKGVFFLLLNFPGELSVIPHQAITTFAREDGDFHYQTGTGKERIIRRLTTRLDQAAAGSLKQAADRRDEELRDIAVWEEGTG